MMVATKRRLMGPQRLGGAQGPVGTQPHRAEWSARWLKVRCASHLGYASVWANHAPCGERPVCACRTPVHLLKHQTRVSSASFNYSIRCLCMVTLLYLLRFLAKTLCLCSQPAQHVHVGHCMALGLALLADVGKGRNHLLLRPVQHGTAHSRSFKELAGLCVKVESLSPSPHVFGLPRVNICNT